MASVTNLRSNHHAKLAAWSPLFVLPVVAVWSTRNSAAWLCMWVLAFSIYAGLKWLSYSEYVENHVCTVRRSIGYLFAWPGMDAKSFLSISPSVAPPLRWEWRAAVAKMVIGCVLIGIAVAIVNRQMWVAGWTGMVGITLALHFGTFHLLSTAWRQAGVDARPLMDAPLLATSLNDFWGKRWNLAFRDLAHTYVFRTCVGRWGIAVATMAVFVVSGVIHDVVISLPARAGYGLPTLYFVIQGVGVLFERSHLGKRLGLRHGAVGRIYCAILILAPVGLLFHPPFVERVIVPMLTMFRLDGS
ncbi:MBOAT family protein [Symmachiella dynata]|uniref:MBOAT family protein n=1 Tax=Symmachiella dynata TaxID=2527995 RepID=UPI0030EE46F9